MQPPAATVAAKTILSSGRILVFAELEYPIGLNHKLNGGKPFVTLCEITFHFRKWNLVIPAKYQFDGASIPRPLWALKGFSPLDRSILAALVHDWITENPDELDRVIGDAIFVVLLKHSGVGCFRRWVMFKGVRLWSTWRAIQATLNWREAFKDENTNKP